MRLFVSGSAPLLAETHVEFERRTGQRILERYGMTETGMLTSNPLEGERRAGSVGPAAARAPRCAWSTTRAAACAPGGHRPRAGARAPTSSRATGACRRRTRRSSPPTASSAPATWAASRRDGYLTIVGRSKDLIITGGYNVYPKEIELALDELPGVQESAVVGVPHPDFGEAVTAVVVARAGVRSAHRGGDDRGAEVAGSRTSRSPSACTSSTSCRATPWARCRRTCCATASQNSHGCAPGCEQIDSS